MRWTGFLKAGIFLLGCGWHAFAAAAGTIVVYGDSLSAAYGISQQAGWVSLLEQRVHAKGFDYNVVNASISGETSSGGAARIEKVLQRDQPAIFILALGANDGLRGLPIAQMKDNLATILRNAQSRGARVLLVGMRIPPNYGPQYTQAFEQSFADLAKKYKTAYVPFLLAKVADRRDNFQPDNLHPTAAVQSTILDTVWQGLQPLLKKTVAK
jgi:acyl-CoA thioesterase-1